MKRCDEIYLLINFYFCHKLMSKLGNVTINQNERPGYPLVLLYCMLMLLLFLIPPFQTNMPIYFNSLNLKTNFNDFCFECEKHSQRAVIYRGFSSF